MAAHPSSAQSRAAAYASRWDNPPAPWSQALLSMLHPVQIAVVEAELRIALPMSAADLHEILGREWPLGTVAYHVRRLAAAGVLVERYREPRRGSAECFYLLAS